MATGDGGGTGKVGECCCEGVRSDDGLVGRRSVGGRDPGEEGRGRTQGVRMVRVGVVVLGRWLR